MTRCLGATAYLNVGGYTNQLIEALREGKDKSAYQRFCHFTPTFEKLANEANISFNSSRNSEKLPENITNYIDKLFRTGVPDKPDGPIPQLIALYEENPDNEQIRHNILSYLREVIRLNSYASKKAGIEKEISRYIFNKFIKTLGKKPDAIKLLWLLSNNDKFYKFNYDVVLNNQEDPGCQDFGYSCLHYLLLHDRGFFKTAVKEIPDEHINLPHTKEKYRERCREKLAEGEKLVALKNGSPYFGVRIDMNGELNDKFYDPKILGMAMVPTLLDLAIDLGDVDLIIELSGKGGCCNDHYTISNHETIAKVSFSDNDWKRLRNHVRTIKDKDSLKYQSLCRRLLYIAYLSKHEKAIEYLVTHTENISFQVPLKVVDGTIHTTSLINLALIQSQESKNPHPFLKHMLEKRITEVTGFNFRKEWLDILVDINAWELVRIIFAKISGKHTFEMLAKSSLSKLRENSVSNQDQIVKLIETILDCGSEMFQAIVGFIYKYCEKLRKEKNGAISIADRVILLVIQNGNISIFDKIKLCKASLFKYKEGLTQNNLLKQLGLLAEEASPPDDVIKVLKQIREFDQDFFPALLITVLHHTPLHWQDPIANAFIVDLIQHSSSLVNPKNPKKYESLYHQIKQATSDYNTEKWITILNSVATSKPNNNEGSQTRLHFLLILLSYIPPIVFQNILFNKVLSDEEKTAIIPFRKLLRNLVREILSIQDGLAPDARLFSQDSVLHHDGEVYDFYVAIKLLLQLPHGIKLNHRLVFIVHVLETSAKETYQQKLDGYNSVYADYDFPVNMDMISADEKMAIDEDKTASQKETEDLAYILCDCSRKDAEAHLSKLQPTRLDRAISAGSWPEIIRLHQEGHTVNLQSLLVNHPYDQYSRISKNGWDELENYIKTTTDKKFITRLCFAAIKGNDVGLIFRLLNRGVDLTTVLFEPHSFNHRELKPVRLAALIINYFYKKQYIPLIAGLQVFLNRLGGLGQLTPFEATLFNQYIIMLLRKGHYEQALMILNTFPDASMENVKLALIILVDAEINDEIKEKYKESTVYPTNFRDLKNKFSACIEKNISLNNKPINIVDVIEVCGYSEDNKISHELFMRGLSFQYKPSMLPSLYRDIMKKIVENYSIEDWYNIYNYLHNSERWVDMLALLPFTPTDIRKGLCKNYLDVNTICAVTNASPTMLNFFYEKHRILNILGGFFGIKNDRLFSSQLARNNGNIFGVSEKVLCDFLQHKNPEFRHELEEMWFSALNEMVWQLENSLDCKLPVVSQGLFRMDGKEWIVMDERKPRLVVPSGVDDNTKLPLNNVAKDEVSAEAAGTESDDNSDNDDDVYGAYRAALN